VKNIIVCCDGTDNQFSGDHTNVIRAFKVAEGLPGQACYYDPGVGTLPQPGFVTNWGEKWSIIAGLAFGAGLVADVQEAYEYLMAVYEPGDLIYLFGFSRGAFTVRALAGMINAVGLLYPDSDQLVPYATNYWRSHKGDNSPGGRVCAEFKATLARDCPIHFVGVWDTVSSVGFVNLFRNISSFPFTFRNPGVAHVRHAVSIDERRCFFRQNLMSRSDPLQDVKNVWFAGVHSDVGGGYPVAESGLSKLAFEWMMVEASSLGFKIDRGASDAGYDRELVHGQGPDPAGKLHRSLTGGWYVAEVLPIRHYSFQDHKYHLRFNLARPRDVEISRTLPGTFIHESVLKRMDAVPTYRPPNLPSSSAAVREHYVIEPQVPLPAALIGVL
jgi:uncharacterized protein (DUF2235 family)